MDVGGGDTANLTTTPPFSIYSGVLWNLECTAGDSQETQYPLLTSFTFSFQAYTSPP